MTLNLVAQKRDVFGKQTKQLRKKGFVPAELYGRGIQNLHLSLSRQEFLKAFREAGENTIINVMIDGKPHPVLIYDVQRDSISGEFLNIDFYQFRADEEIELQVPIVFIGEAPAVKEKGAVLTKAMDQVEIRALPADIPHHLEVNLSVLTDIGQSVYVKDLPSGKFEILVSPGTVVVTASEVKVEEEVPVIDESAQIEGVAVETEEKKAERAQEKEAKESSSEASTPKATK
ncbi:MAG: hypothetical protein A3F24_00220 [Candidatus Colwellbacteria bacterium RIFCSPHIGHO2_12_FULL_44_17]|uniref:Large ribosomal subunit protein bL25 n=2 Tax=Candidatus Colwelliibacteriota TaxID=1817904 RepID=A0A1G1Z2F2_9BACT|nr:MAG: hypothetical protein A3F24_00220 [Candidatus Colwellbacteria bacterium RIFCSPHIGHO2_12_FULL_44_17]